MEGSSDDLDMPIKAVFGDVAFVEQYRLCSINSINWSRVMIQLSHHIYSYLQLAENPGEDVVEVVVPSGACGNITGEMCRTNE